MLENNAQNHQRDLAFRYKIKTKVRQSPINKFFEVYVLASDDFGKAEKKALELQKRFKNKTIWILCVPRKTEGTQEDE